MSALISPLAGLPASNAPLLDVPALLAAYEDVHPDPSLPAQRVAFGTSGHRGSSFDGSFNEWHVLAISQAVCEYRAQQGITGPLFLGIDTHALSASALRSTLEVLAANGVETLLAPGSEYTPTPALSHAILCWNRGRQAGLADGIVLTPSHNPPESGGYKYNPTNGGPADTDVTGWIQTRANALLEAKLAGVRRMPYQQARATASTREHDFLSAYVADLGNVVDLAAIRAAGIRMGVDPLGGAGVHYWARIAEHYDLNLTVISEQVDPTFRFMSLDWDGRIRMDPSSAHAMQRLIALKDRFDIAFACDTDHDRHGIVTSSAGLLPTNHYLSVMIDYLFRQRPGWRGAAGVGKTIVSSSMIDRVTAQLGRSLYEVPVGFKWFVEGLQASTLSFVGEESAGATCSRLDGTVWTTDKDGIVPALLSAEIIARSGRDPGAYYADITRQFGAPLSVRVDAPATPAQKRGLSKLSAAQLHSTMLAGDPIERVLDRAPGNGAPIGGIKVMAANGWFAARPSGTEDIYKIYAESFRDQAHLDAIVAEAQSIVDAATASTPAGGDGGGN
jgi:phosphoglucomutase